MAFHHAFGNEDVIVVETYKCSKFRRFFRERKNQQRLFVSFENATTTTTELTVNFFTTAAGLLEKHPVNVLGVSVSFDGWRDEHFRAFEEFYFKNESQRFLMYVPSACIMVTYSSGLNEGTITLEI